MRAIILAGGQGSRLLPYTMLLPKPLIPLDDLPILQIILLQLRQAGVTRVTLALCYKAQQIIRYFGDGQWLGLSIEYACTTEFLGTAGPLALIDSFTEPTLVLNADILTKVNFADVACTHQRSEAIATIVLHRYRASVPYGVVEIDHQGSVCTIREKPEYTFAINTGIYMLDPLVKASIPVGVRQDMPDLLRRVIKQGQVVNSYFFEGDWFDIGTPEQFHHARERFRAQRERYIPFSPSSTASIEQGVKVSALGLEAMQHTAVDSSQIISLWR